MNKVFPGYSFTIWLGQPVDIEGKTISFVIKEVAWHSQDWPKGCDKRTPLFFNAKYLERKKEQKTYLNSKLSGLVAKKNVKKGFIF